MYFFKFSVDSLEAADISPQARYEHFDHNHTIGSPSSYSQDIINSPPALSPSSVDSSLSPSPVSPNIVQVKNAEELTEYIRNFVQQSTRPNKEPKSRFVKTLADNDVGFPAGESVESALAALKLENISKKLAEYISQQEAHQGLKRMFQPPLAHRMSDENIPANEETMMANASMLSNEHVPANEQAPGDISANENVPFVVSSNERLPVTSTAHGTVASNGGGPPPQVVEVYINGQLQHSEVEKETTDLTVSQLSSQYLGQT